LSRRKAVGIEQDASEHNEDAAAGYERHPFGRRRSIEEEGCGSRYRAADRQPEDTEAGSRDNIST
jgi:hypothetical protein